MKCISLHKMLVVWGVLKLVALLGVLEGRGHIVGCEELGLICGGVHTRRPSTLRLINIPKIVVRPVLVPPHESRCRYWVAPHMRNMRTAATCRNTSRIQN